MFTVLINILMLSANLSIRFLDVTDHQSNMVASANTDIEVRKETYTDKLYKANYDTYLDSKYPEIIEILKADTKFRPFDLKNYSITEYIAVYNDKPNDKIVSIFKIRSVNNDVYLGIKTKDGQYFTEDARLILTFAQVFDKLYYASYSGQ